MLNTRSIRMGLPWSSWFPRAPILLWPSPEPAYCYTLVHLVCPVKAQDTPCSLQEFKQHPALNVQYNLCSIISQAEEARESWLLKLHKAAPLHTPLVMYKRQA